MSAPSVTLAVLAGGQGSRMGTAKSNLIIDGVPVLARLLQRLNWDGPTLLVTAPSNKCPPGAEIFDREVTDPIDAGGPVQGLLTALLASETDQIVLVPLDMPMLTSDQLRLLASQPEQAVLCSRRFDGETLVEPFPSMFRKCLIPLLHDYLAQQRRSLHGLLKLPDCRCIDVTAWPPETWINLNTPEDLARYEREFAR